MSMNGDFALATYIERNKMQITLISGADIRVTNCSLYI